MTVGMDRLPQNKSFKQWRQTDQSEYSDNLSIFYSCCLEVGSIQTKKSININSRFTPITTLTVCVCASVWLGETEVSLENPENHRGHANSTFLLWHECANHWKMVPPGDNQAYGILESFMQFFSYFWHSILNSILISSVWKHQRNTTSSFPITGTHPVTFGPDVNNEILTEGCGTSKKQCHVFDSDGSESHTFAWYKNRALRSEERR